MNGKNKCKILKDIRRQIALENDIDYVTTDCQFQGECKGTCPKCEAEVRYLENELQKRRRAGKVAAVAGVAAAVMMTATSCGNTAAPSQTDTDQTASTTYYQVEDGQTSGELIVPTTTTAPSEEYVLMGDVPYEEDLVDGEMDVPPVEEELLMGEVPIDESC